MEGELVQRAYTPVSPSNARGFLDMLIKVRFSCVHFLFRGRFPDADFSRCITARQTSPKAAR